MYQSRLFTSNALAILLALNALLAQAANAQSSFTVATHTPQASQPPSSNAKADPKNQVTLSQQPGGTSSRYTKALAQGNGAPEVEGTYGTSTLKAVESGTMLCAINICQWLTIS